MGTGCVSEVDMFMAYRREIRDEQSVSILRHVAQCPLCHDLWKRFELDEKIASGFQCAIQGDAEGADTGPGWGLDEELPEDLDIPGFTIHPGYIEGGQARVYCGTYEASQEEVAIKVFHNSRLNEGGYERFSREMKSLGRLRHANVITIRSDGEIGGHAYFVMPWIEGLALDEYVQRTPLSFNQKVEMVGKVCEAVSHAHRRGVMHLDLKPTNVRVDTNGEPMVMDFGLARPTETDYAEPPGMSLGIAGTPLYMAPEQIENREDLDVRADVYGLGLLLYEVLVGRRAKGAQLTQSQQPTREMIQETPPPPRGVNPKVPSELEAITVRAIEVDPDRRYQTAEALLEDLHNYRQGRMVQAKAHLPAYRLRKWLRRYWEKIAGLGLVALVVGFGIASRIIVDKRTAAAKAAVDEVREQAYKVLTEREKKLATDRYGLHRQLIEALEEIELQASVLGNWDLADESFERAQRIRAELGDLEPVGAVGGEEVQ